MSVVDALLLLAADDRSGARAACETSADSSRLASWLGDALTRPPGGEVFVDPDAFERFISGGSNVSLYAATIDVLSDLQRHRQVVSMVDIGCGDGRVTAATLPDSCQELHLVEPSEALLRVAVDRIGSEVSVVESHSCTLQQMLELEPDREWDAAQSTFALHNLPPSDRARALQGLASRTKSIAIVEFDVPGFRDRSREHAAYAAAVYEEGVAEYENDPTVITGFLLPVLIGQFAPDQPRHTYEQSAAAWAADLERAGFSEVTVSPVADFWWANAKLIVGAHSARS